MSASQQQMINWEPDEYLMSQTSFPQEITLDPKYKNIRMWTPVGRITFAHFDTPKAAQPGNANQEPTFACSLLLSPQSIDQLYSAICQVAEARFAPENRFDPQTQQMRTFTATQLFNQDQGLKYPINLGNTYFNREPAKYTAWKDVYVINASTSAHDKAGNIVRPPVLDEGGTIIKQPGRIYSGCYGRLYVTIFAFPAPGKTLSNRGIGMRLSAVQFARNGVKMANYDPEAAAVKAAIAVGALPVHTPPPPPQGAMPGQAPGSMALAGMAAPPAPPMAPAAPPPQVQPQYQAPVQPQPQYQAPEAQPVQYAQAPAPAAPMNYAAPPQAPMNYAAPPQPAPQPPTAAPINYAAPPPGYAPPPPAAYPDGTRPAGA